MQWKELGELHRVVNMQPGSCVGVGMIGRKEAISSAHYSKAPPPPAPGPPLAVQAPSVGMFTPPSAYTRAALPTHSAHSSQTQ